jgi:hypothetical protein
MLTTTKSIQFQIEISDSTVAISSGTAKIGNSLYPFTGARITYADMLNFSPTDSSLYQNILLYLEAPSGLISNLTSAVSAPVPSPTNLSVPAMADSSGFPISLFTLYSPDGTQANLISYTTA